MIYIIIESMASRAINDSVAEFLDYVRGGGRGDAAVNVSAEATNVTSGNATCDPRPAPTRQTEMVAVRIMLYLVIFLLSVFGNLLVIVVLMLNKRMRTVTNSFLLSLAVSDLMMAVCCMPFTLIPNILKDYIFGAAMCKITAYFMGISVSISTFSLVAIAIERYSAICNPLKSRAWQTRSHAYRVIATTWALSLFIMVPYPVFSLLKPSHKPDCTLRHSCRLLWPSQGVEQTWYMLLLVTLFFIPGVVMIVAYGLISRELFRGVQFELSQNREATGQKNGINITGCNNDDDGCYVQVPKKPPSSMELSALSASSSSSGGGARARAERARGTTSEAKLRAKRRVIRMLMVIVALFFACWMPLYSVNVWRALDPASALGALSGAPISFIHLLSYTSACVNPLVYCFMNARFRAALLATFACCCGARLCRRRGRSRGGDGGEDGATTVSMATSMSKFSYTTVSTVGPY